ncbi:MAG TPA: hypothetical protein VJA86_03690 [Candidatus Nanoarchaeia archaeon]|nr:hypothetical protein [Candidatus Nanoarchaeia archaeon]
MEKEKASEVLGWEKREDADELKDETAKLIGYLRRIQSEASCLTFQLGISASCKHPLTPEIKAIPQEIMSIQQKLENFHAKLFSS